MRQPARSFWLSGLVTLCCLAAIGVSTISPIHASPPPYIPQPQMLVNLNTSSSASDPTYLTEFNGQVYFQANDGQHGYEIWRSDGTPDGTTLFVDIIDGPGSTNPSKFSVVGSQMFFDAYSFEGPSLWVTDGTPEGTRLVKDINARSDGSGPYYMTEFDGRLCFIFDSTYWSNSELWCSDGTADGTVLIKDVQPGTYETDSIPWGQKHGLVVAGGKMFFAAEDGTHGVELWVSDGTTDGTYLLKDINPTGSSTPQNLTALDSLVLFSADDGTHGREIWVSDGTETGTRMLADLDPAGDANPSHLIAYDGNVYFSASNPGWERTALWRSDGTPENTMSVALINPNIYTEPEYDMAVCGGVLYAGAEGGAEGWELWRSLGTPATTDLVKDINPSGDSAPHNLTCVDGTLYFSAVDDTHGYELWASDGTSGGTHLVKDSNPSGDSNPNFLTGLGSQVLFAARDPQHATELWVSDGSVSGTMIVKDINSMNGSSYPTTMTVLNHSLFFVAQVGYPPGLYRTRGHIGEVDYLNPMRDDELMGFEMIASGDTLYFQNAYSYEGAELWAVKEDSPNGWLAVDVNPDSYDSYPDSFLDADGTLYFSAWDWDVGGELRAINDSGYWVVKDICPGRDSSWPYTLGYAGGVVFLNVGGCSGDDELWRTDGTADGTYLVKDINPTGAGYPYNFFSFNDIGLFTANDGVTGYELWRSDGTEGGTYLVKDINPTGDSYPSLLIRLGERMLFSAVDDAHGQELWITDGTLDGTLLVKDINPGPENGSPYDFIVVGDRAYFSAGSGPGNSQNRELWTSDGTPEGTYQVLEIRPGTGLYDSADPNQFVTPEGSAYFFFVADDGVHGYELWVSDGTADGTQMVKDINPNGNGLAVWPFGNNQPVAMGGFVFFPADDGVNGIELWRVAAPDSFIQFLPIFGN